nr:MAG TPA: hypothetical protein [Caudoviricetes sp.]
MALTTRARGAVQFPSSFVLLSCCVVLCRAQGADVL